MYNKIDMVGIWTSYWKLYSCSDKFREAKELETLYLLPQGIYVKDSSYITVRSYMYW